MQDIIESKEYFLSKVAQELGLNNDSKIVEFGSGQSRAVLPLLNTFPQMSYLGIEPSAKDAAVAKELVKNFKNARVLNQLAYDEAPGAGDFDLCFSLSVLEHVKQLEKFLSNSVKAVRSGGRIIHRYDLGHALRPSSAKERFQVFLGNTFPSLLPEHKFVRYLSDEEVREILEKYGARVEKKTYHQMPNHKALLKVFRADSEPKRRLIEQMMDWEQDISPYLEGMEKREREMLFPGIALWARRAEVGE
ncbi:MAG: class I SAM-dependent methyltransferase [Candidatus Harrisonbacteria bacterium]|nr:class I SAM-dependent methyltransferase [Candidatus Harrisonbacteria bacterium]